jgi:hypothetical protein
MDLNPFPIEKEFSVLAIRRRFKDLSREELEEFLSESLLVMAKMTHQLTQLRDHLQEIEGVKPLS